MNIYSMTDELGHMLKKGSESWDEETRKVSLMIR